MSYPVTIQLITLNALQIKHNSESQFPPPETALCGADSGTPGYLVFVTAEEIPGIRGIRSRNHGIPRASKYRFGVPSLTGAS